MRISSPQAQSHFHIPRTRRPSLILIRKNFLLPNSVTEGAQCRAPGVSCRSEMVAPASDSTSELAPGFYWLRQQDESSGAWTVVRVYRHRKRLRIQILATKADKPLENFEDLDQALGPEARMPSTRSARSTTAASG